ncbi:hypothetical protein AC369_03105 [Salmonella enterica subsp. diarizonae]|nr:hypothetical protein [Salmonella enterica]EBF4781614.1 hypothetical protein [Salmonella enterica subsp. diarizonae]ECF6854373.1 hypothetical protein [Salmonella enterica subsp. arizonae]EDW1846967.1 hypothetical protein [Salmonella enterica subsp. enterica]HCM1891757.1 hypothetical protein [Salmonella enterica subsp. diarizonae serovar 57:c:e,n,x,z15]
MNDHSFTRKIEIIKLIVSVIISLSVASIAYVVQHSVVEQQAHRTLLSNISAKIIDKRLSIYDQIKIPLNRIYCFIEEKGDWQSYSPEEIIKTHNMLNEIVYSQRAIWSKKTIERYTEYMNQQAFIIDNIHHGIKIRAEINDLRRAAPGWNDNYRTLFTGERSIFHRNAYQELNNALAEDLMLTKSELILSQYDKLSTSRN